MNVRIKKVLVICVNDKMFYKGFSLGLFSMAKSAAGKITWEKLPLNDLIGFGIFSNAFMLLINSNTFI